MKNQAEQSFFEAAGVSVTNTRANLNGTTYSMANITSVKCQVTPPDTSTAKSLIKTAIVILVIGLPVLSAAFALGAVLVLVGIILLAAGIFLRKKAKPFYSIIIGSAGGETDALTSQDGKSIQAIVAAINQAFVHRG
ncbi:MAG: DUF6232 family protein [Verrucomicrobiota bacterium]